jgi:hypothetical protein
MAAIPHTVLLAAIRQCVTVVEPGEVLAVRVAESATDQEMGFLTRFAYDIHEQCGAQVLFLRAAEFARLKARDAA